MWRISSACVIEQWIPGHLSWPEGITSGYTCPVSEARETVLGIAEVTPRYCQEQATDSYHQPNYDRHRPTSTRLGSICHRGSASTETILEQGIVLRHLFWLDVPRFAQAAPPKDRFSLSAHPHPI